MKISAYNILSLPDPLEIPTYPRHFLRTVLDADRMANVILYAQDNVFVLSRSLRRPTWIFLEERTKPQPRIEIILEVDSHELLFQPFAKNEEGSGELYGHTISRGLYVRGAASSAYEYTWTLWPGRAEEILEYLRGNDPLAEVT